MAPPMNHGGGIPCKQLPVAPLSLIDTFHALDEHHLQCLASLDLQTLFHVAAACGTHLRVGMEENLIDLSVLGQWKDFKNNVLVDRFH